MSEKTSKVFKVYKYTIRKEYKFWDWYTVDEPNWIERNILEINLSVDHENSYADCWLALKFIFDKNCQENQTGKPVFLIEQTIFAC